MEKISVQDKKINIILKGDFRINLSPDSNLVKGSFNHDLTFSNSDTVDFIIAKKNSLGSWIPEDNAIRDLIGDFFEDGFTGSGEELVKLITDDFLIKKEVLLNKERQKYDEKITVSINVLFGLMNRLSKSNPQNLRNSFLSRSMKGDLDSLYRKDLYFLDQEINHLLTDDEIQKVATLKVFFTALDDCKNEDSFEVLKRFCKN